ncbi:MAG: flippase-like domain-containing protein, partial [Chloroflexi bacterium]|nr:flippase-like domain-containing protein [Chloroflexota bacterium]
MFPRLRVVAAFGLTAVFLYLAVQNVHPAQLFEVLRAVDYWQLLPAAALTLTGYVFRTVRWRSILAPIKRLSVTTLFPILIMGFAANNVLPARMGEIIRAYGVGRRAGISRSLGLATIFIERVFDGITLLLVMVVVLALFPSSGRDLNTRLVGGFAAAVFVLAGGGLLLLLHRRALALRLLDAAVRPLPGRIAALARRMLGNFIEGLEVLRGGRHLLGVVFFSLVVWGCEAASYVLVLRAFPIELTTVERLLAGLFVLVFVNLGIMVPSAPGYIGTFQFFARLALTAFGVGGALALAIAVAAHAMQYLLVTSLGAVFLIRENVAFAGVGSRESGIGGRESGIEGRGLGLR